MRIRSAKIELVEEPLKAVFGFKGQYSAKPMCNTAVRLESDTGCAATGLANQGILWSDAAVYSHFSHFGGNSLMYLMTEYALQRSVGVEFDTPSELLRELYPQVLAYGKTITGLPQLRQTFALNALVAVDTAAWLLYAKEKGLDSFDALTPAQARPYLQARHGQIAAIPLITYTVPMADILKEVAGGCFFLKIKLGADPDHDGDQEKMLAWDMQRISEIHNALKDVPCAHTDNGRIPYYLDANGRYLAKERLVRLLEHADRIGALSRIAVLEEPFPEHADIDVSDLPVRLAADESAHSDADVRERIQMGYRAIALKPIAKTMSMTFDMLAVCGENNIPCFCADLTVNAAMVDLNKNFAARLPALPGLKMGLLESNGHQYYANWEKMLADLPYAGASWVQPQDGLYRLDDTFYAKSGGIFLESPRYDGLF